MLVETKVKMSLMEAANHLQVMMEMLDEGQEIDEYVGKNYLWADDQATASIDRRKYLLREIESKVEMLKKMQGEIKKHLQRMDKIADSVIESTKQALLANPKASVRDSIGNKVTLCQGKKKLEIMVPTGEQKFKNVLSLEESHRLYKIGYGSYVENNTFYYLDTDKIRKDLEDGMILEGLAFLSENTYVRGL
jgi:predicted nuclease with TOPRIM domain